MAKLEFGDEGSRLVEEFNASAGAKARRARILDALGLTTGCRVLDVGSGPGHQAFEMSSVVGSSGRVDGIDPADSAIAIARRRCSDLTNVNFQPGEATKIPFGDSIFDAAMSSQVFEYLEDVPAALAEMFRILKSGGRVLIHDTDWGGKSLTDAAEASGEQRWRLPVRTGRSNRTRSWAWGGLMPLSPISRGFRHSSTPDGLATA